MVQKRKNELYSCDSKTGNFILSENMYIISSYFIYKERFRLKQQQKSVLAVKKHVMCFLAYRRTWVFSFGMTGIHTWGGANLFSISIFLAFFIRDFCAFFIASSHSAFILAVLVVLLTPIALRVSGLSTSKGVWISQ